MPKIIFRPNPTPPPFVPPTPPTPQSTIRFATYPFDEGANTYYLHGVEQPQDATFWALQFLLVGVENWETYDELSIESFSNDQPLDFWSGSPSSDYAAFRVYFGKDGVPFLSIVNLTLDES